MHKSFKLHNFNVNNDVSFLICAFPIDFHELDPEQKEGEILGSIIDNIELITILFYHQKIYKPRARNSKTNQIQDMIAATCSKYPHYFCQTKKLDKQATTKKQEK